MVKKIDLKFVIKKIFAIKCKKIDLPKVYFSLYINFYLLYHYLIQLKTASEKQLVINIMTLR